MPNRTVIVDGPTAESSESYQQKVRKTQNLGSLKFDQFEFSDGNPNKHSQESYTPFSLPDSSEEADSQKLATHL